MCTGPVGWVYDLEDDVHASGVGVIRKDSSEASKCCKKTIGLFGPSGVESQRPLFTNWPIGECMGLWAAMCRDLCIGWCAWSYLPIEISTLHTASIMSCSYALLPPKSQGRIIPLWSADASMQYPEC